MNADLHCHSTVSDGLLAPDALARRAAANGVELWALTDHDHLGGLDLARAAAEEEGVRFVNGVEISVSWRGHTVHVVGLGIDHCNDALVAGLERVRGGRDARARRMGEDLERIGVREPYAGALRHAKNPALVSRSHFARYLVEQGYGSDVRSVFDHYLVRGKPGYVETEWARLDEAVDWIRGAGGVAVVAHPGRYRVSRAEVKQLLQEFKDLGGQGVEVVSGVHSEQDCRDFARLARQLGLLASRASDFHGPGESACDLGKSPALPEDLVPVWTCLG